MKITVWRLALMERLAKSHGATIVWPDGRITGNQPSGWQATWTHAESPYGRRPGRSVELEFEL
jgi:hypothetical protein